MIDVNAWIMAIDLMEEKVETKKITERDLLRPHGLDCREDFLSEEGLRRKETVIKTAEQLGYEVVAEPADLSLEARSFSGGPMIVVRVFGPAHGREWRRLTSEEASQVVDWWNARGTVRELVEDLENRVDFTDSCKMVREALDGRMP